MRASSMLLSSLLLAMALVLGASAQEGEVAYAAPPPTPEQVAADNPLTCASPCYSVVSRYPFKQCGPTCDPAVCNRGYGVFQSQDVCCQVSFPDGGCTQRPSQCWVVESYALRTCVRDDRKCLQGYGVYPTEAACCAPQGPGPLAAAPGAFPNGCGNVTKAAEPCYVVDTYWPSRQCRQSRTLCAQDSGVKSFANKTDCCAPETGAFSEGCSNYTIPVPCWVVDSYYPNRSCRRSSDVAVCNRGWGVFASEDICCAPGASFSEGCSVRSNITAPPTTPAASASVATTATATLPASQMTGVVPPTVPESAAVPPQQPAIITAPVTSVTTAPATTAPATTAPATTAPATTAPMLPVGTQG